ncbi:hypothetical protein M413DRAFT_440610 [Hebeloma cylindrosporum]|uniref:Uncharacterized protein n=1 Tax=Hebeloma cylindrosporum TaxID=76867 RepID=A0A0C3CSL7_HEBCY|nr:hypothetical protein M413DRAFT_440610 [Hebeloma cylindrosporum h7]
MSENKGAHGVAVADLQPPHEAAPPAYPVPQLAPTPTPVLAHPAPAPVPVDPAAAAAIGQQYRDQLFAQCAIGNHERTTNYGIGGIIAAIVCFPCGLICLFADKQEKCARCGVSLDRK